MVGVVLIDYNSYLRTVRFISDLLKATDTMICGIAIVDNSPADENYYAMISELKAMGFCEEQSQAHEAFTHLTKGIIETTSIYLIRTGENIGFARANNLGYKVLKNTQTPKYVVFSNSDIQFSDNKLELTKLIDCFFDSSDIAMVGPMIWGTNGKRQSPSRYLSIYSRWWGRAILWPVWPHLINPKIKKIKKKGYVYSMLGAFMVAKSSDFERINGFDEETFLYAEEEIISERYRRIGKKMYCNPEVIIYHEGGHTTHSKKMGREEREQWIMKHWQSDKYYYEHYRGIKPATIRATRCFIKLFFWKLRLKDKFSRKSGK